jgi:hypothetical protein
MLDFGYEYIFFVIILLSILVISFGSRGKVFCQYLKYMTGIELTPSEVMTVYRQAGRPGVRDLFLDLLIREDLEEMPTITPDTPRSKPVTGLINR